MLSSISITSFRGIWELNINLGPRTYIMWANGSGKTHILDAIHILTGSRPLYGDTILEPGTQFEGSFSEYDLSKSYRKVRDEIKEYFLIQWVKVTKWKYMQSLPWRTVHISPFDMNLLYFAPSMRRDYMDTVLSRSHGQFSALKKNYDIVMRQRNALLKKIRDGEAKRQDLDFWDHKFAECADTYWQYRINYRDYIQSAISRFPSFFSKYLPFFHYESNWIDELDRWGFIEKYLYENRERDILTGHTHIGPHRDDWCFQILHDNKNISVEHYFSRGEMKMLLLWLKMIEVDYINATLNIPVILLIDDIFAELDENNCEIFLNSLMQYQIILTSQKPLPNHEKYHNFICINIANT